MRLTIIEPAGGYGDMRRAVAAMMDSMRLSAPRIIVCESDAESILKALKAAIEPGGLILIAGGMGPDEGARPAAAALLGAPLGYSQRAASMIRAGCEARCLLFDDYKECCMVPKGAALLSSEGLLPSYICMADECAIMLLDGREDKLILSRIGALLTAVAQDDESPDAQPEDNAVCDETKAPPAVAKKRKTQPRAPEKTTARRKGRSLYTVLHTSRGVLTGCAAIACVLVVMAAASLWGLLGGDAPAVAGGDNVSSSGAASSALVSQPQGIGASESEPVSAPESSLAAATSKVESPVASQAQSSSSQAVSSSSQAASSSSQAASSSSQAVSSSSQAASSSSQAVSSSSQAVSSSSQAVSSSSQVESSSSQPIVVSSAAPASSSEASSQAESEYEYIYDPATEEEEDDEASSSAATQVSSAAQVQRYTGALPTADSSAFDETLSYSVNGRAYRMNAYDLVCEVLQNETRGVLSEQALKAHAIATYTMIKYNNSIGTAPAVALNSGVSQSVKNAVDDVLGVAVYYNGRLANTVYHSTSCGYTTSSQAVWGGALPYLVSVESPYDSQSPYYASSYSISSSQFEKLVSRVYGIELDGDPADWITIKHDAPGGYVGTVTLGGETRSQGGTAGTSLITGRSIRERLLSYSLRSHCFDVEYDEASDKFVFSVRGYGHGVGMSQYGAHFMAQAGYNYVEILQHYYTGTEVY